MSFTPYKAISKGFIKIFSIKKSIVFKFPKTPLVKTEGKSEYRSNEFNYEYELDINISSFIS